MNREGIYMPVYSIKTIKEYANNYISNNGREITKTVLLITSAVILFRPLIFSQVLRLYFRINYINNATRVSLRIIKNC